MCESVSSNQRCPDREVLLCVNLCPQIRGVLIERFYIQFHFHVELYELTVNLPGPI